MTLAIYLVASIGSALSRGVLEGWPRSRLQAKVFSCNLLPTWPSIRWCVNEHVWGVYRRLGGGCGLGLPHSAGFVGVTAFELCAKFDKCQSSRPCFPPLQAMAARRYNAIVPVTSQAYWFNRFLTVGPWLEGETSLWVETCRNLVVQSWSITFAVEK